MLEISTSPLNVGKVLHFGRQFCDRKMFIDSPKFGKGNCGFDEMKNACIKLMIASR